MNRNGALRTANRGNNVIGAGTWLTCTVARSARTRRRGDDCNSENPCSERGMPPSRKVYIPSFGQLAQSQEATTSISIATATRYEPVYKPIQ